LTPWPRGYRKAHHAEIDSTNSEAKRLAEAGDPGAVWIVADQQTAGRGRRGRVWQTQQGNLATTLLIRPQGAQVAQLSFAAALAVSDTIAAFAPQAAIAVKWPNDVLAERRKIAGILLEAGPCWLAVGMGVNLAAAPEDTEFPAIALADLGVTPPSPDAALAVSDTIAAFAPQAAIAVKWPNDVLAERRKIAGILLEAGPGWLAVGMGVNLAAAPEDTEFPAIALADLGVTPPSPDAALAVIANRFAHWYDVWVEDGFEPLRTAWLARAGGLGMPIRARLPHEERHGVFEGIDANGALLLNEQGRIRPISAGEVFF
jgi:biotin-(acetyl-CoA carboxylase) ligase